MSSLYAASVTLHGWVTLVACGGQAMLAFLSLRTRDPLAAPLAILSADLFVWNLADLAFETSGVSAFHLLDLATSPFAPALGLHFVLLFVGKRRALQRLLSAAYAFFGGLSALAAAGFLRPSREPAPGEFVWATLLVVGVTVSVVLSAWLLLTHHRESGNPEERARTRLLLLALPLAAVLETTDLINPLVPAVPALSPAGTFAFALAMAVVTLRRRLFGRDLSTSAALCGAFVAAIAVGGAILVFRAFAASTVMLMVGSAVLCVAVAAATRAIVIASAAHRARALELFVLGRFAAQMAHDLRNPLAALKGAVEFLKEERRRGRSLDAQEQFLDLMADEAERMQRTIEGYHRLGRIEPAFAPLDMGDLIREVLALSAFSVEAATVRVDADGALPCLVDRDLVARALENLVKNAFEAMPAGGIVTVSAERGEGVVIVRVEDTGAGMDARVAERAFDDFFTTKTRGSGLGLSFVRRVVEAHGGEVSLTSRVGRGSVVEVRLPSPPP